MADHMVMVGSPDGTSESGFHLVELEKSFQMNGATQGVRSGAVTGRGANNCNTFWKSQLLRTSVTQ